MKTAVFLGCAIVAGCARLSEPPAGAAARAAATATATATATASASATASATAPATASAERSPALPFIEDDYPRALAQARARGVPLFVDAWATWCHTCLSVRSYVFPDPVLRPLAGRFVWLAVDTERPENAAAVSRLGVRVLPTFYVIDPVSEAPLLAWPGSLTAPELSLLLENVAASAAPGAGDAGRHAPGSRGASGARPESAALAAADLLRGHRARADGRPRDAATLYRRALGEAPRGWPRRPEVVDALVTSLSDARDFAACAAAASSEASGAGLDAEAPRGTFLADVLRTGIGCAEELPEGGARRAALAALATTGERLASDMAAPILADDRSDLFDFVTSALRSQARAADVARVARTWIAFLEAEAARAPTPAARAVFDAHRLLAAQALGEPGRAVPALEASERDFPADYNPPARLAIAYLALGRKDDALAAVKRAEERAYGPRTLRLWAIEADVDEARGDRAGARRALEAALAFARTTTLTAGYERLRDALAERLANLDANR